MEKDLQTTGTDLEVVKNYNQRKQYFLLPIREMKEYVSRTYDVRHNVITDVYEFRRKEDGDAWQPLDERGFNTIACGIEAADIFCLDSRIDYRQLYAQLVSEVEAGRRTYFTKHEEADMQRRNRRYMAKDELEELFATFFRPARLKKEGELYTSRQVLDVLAQHDRSLNRHYSPDKLGRRLTEMGLRPTHTRQGNAYRLVAL